MTVDQATLDEISKCNNCGGAGHITCSACGGGGTVDGTEGNENGECGACGGKGIVDCPKCHGMSRTTKTLGGELKDFGQAVVDKVKEGVQELSKPKDEDKDPGTVEPVVDVTEPEPF